MKIINLLPKEEQNELKLDVISGQIRTFWVWVVASLVVFLALGFAAQQYLNIRVSALDREITVAQAELQTADSIALQREVQALNRDIREVRSVRGQQYRWSEVLLELARILPAESQLAGVQMDRLTGEVVILGKAENRDAVLDVWSSLKKSALFREVNFPLPNLEQPTDSSFTFTFLVNLEMIQADEFQN